MGTPGIAKPLPATSGGEVETWRGAVTTQGHTPCELWGLVGSQVSWPVERVGLGVVPRLRGHLLLGSTTSLASLQEVMSPQLLGGRVQGAVASLEPCPFPINLGF